MALHIVDTAPSVLAPGIIALANASKAPSADDLIREAQSFDYPILAWYCVAGFILLLPFCRVLGLVYRLNRRPSSLGISRTRGVISYRRLPAAAIHTFHALAFRWTLSIGKSYTLNAVQCFITAAYMATLLTWSFVNCMLLLCYLRVLLLT
jgi:hypothetical protein